MGKYTRKGRRRRAVAAAGVIAALAAAGSAAAFQQLPPGDQVNNDPVAGINPANPVNIEDPTNADVVGGSLNAAKPLVPWAIFRQTESSGDKDQIFSRSFAGGAWTTRGNGTVGGSSSASPIFSGSLNFDQTQDGEAPSIDFAGAGRTVPWAAWYEHTTGASFGADNIFASKFDNTGDANQGKWIFAGQGRGNGGQNNVPVPSLNIHTNRDAVNPVVQGGATVAGNDSGAVGHLARARRWHPRAEPDLHEQGGQAGQRHHVPEPDPAWRGLRAEQQRFLLPAGRRRASRSGNRRDPRDDQRPVDERRSVA